MFQLRETDEKLPEKMVPRPGPWETMKSNGLMAVSQWFNYTKRAVRKLSGPGGFRYGFRSFYIGFGSFSGVERGRGRG